MSTLERTAFMTALIDEFNRQMERYSTLTHELFDTQARVEVCERALMSTRTLLQSEVGMVGGKMPDGSPMPEGWADMFVRVRFLGMRLADACVEVLQEKREISTDDLRVILNNGCFRFRTPSPTREINAALMRNSQIRRDGDKWIYVGAESSEEGQSEEIKMPKAS